MATLNSTLSETSYLSSVAIQDAFRRALAQGISEGVGAAVEAMGKSLTNVAKARPLFLAANQKLAFMMQDSMLHSYDQVVTARKQFGSYRVDEPPGEKSEYAYGRFGGGKLRHALQASDMVVATPQGIAYINRERLDSEAAHWHRLNFGAGNAGGRDSQSFPWRFGGQTLGVLGLTDSPSAAFRMPHGIWSNGEGGLDPGFHPRGSQLNILTKGIEARRFFEAGLRRFAEEGPLVYEDLMFQFVDQALYEARGPLHGVAVNADAIISSL